MISFLLCLAILIGGYFVYGKIVDNTFGPDDRETPAVRINDGVDYVVMPQWKLFLVQLLNIAGLGPIFGALQGALWGPVVFLCDEAGDVPHDITVGDEASEKVQQDTVEAGGAAKEKEDQPTAPYEEETRTPQMLNVDQQEEVAGTITLKKDGTPEYGEVAFSTEQTMVRYRLNIEEDGQYYFGLIKDWNVSAYVSLFERTDEGDNYLSNESYSYELRKDGNYYLEIEKSSEEALETLKWYAGKVRDIKPGEFEAELSENVEEIFYNLTVDETGWYRFSYDALSMSVRDKETGEYISSWSFCKLEQGHTYYVGVNNRNTTGVLSNKWSVKKGKAIPVELGQVYRNENLKEIYYVFVPETTGKYVVKERSTIYDENWKEIERKSDVAAVQMEAGKTYYITVEARYWSIQKYVASEQEAIAHCH